jgi:hypothetical protein
MTIYARTLKETRTINLKLTPIMENRALKYIFVSGRLLHSDYITNRWLEREEADYEIENEISMVHIFSHRLTRNLEGRLSNSGILLIQIALQEAIMNAIEHGSFGIDFEAKTRLRRQDENYMTCSSQPLQRETP